MTSHPASGQWVATPETPGSAGPWRITFDTNPDDCNLRCIMCEDHSPHSSTQPDRRAAGLPKRRMDMDLIRRVLAEASGNGLREIIPSTMGEPLLYRHMDQGNRVLMVIFRIMPMLPVLMKR